GGARPPPRRLVPADPEIRERHEPCRRRAPRPDRDGAGGADGVAAAGRAGDQATRPAGGRSARAFVDRPGHAAGPAVLEDLGQPDSRCAGEPRRGDRAAGTVARCKARPRARAINAAVRPTMLAERSARAPHIGGASWGGAAGLALRDPLFALVVARAP